MTAISAGGWRHICSLSPLGFCGWTLRELKKVRRQVRTQDQQGLFPSDCDPNLRNPDRPAYRNSGQVHPTPGGPGAARALKAPAPGALRAGLPPPAAILSLPAYEQQHPQHSGFAAVGICLPE